LLTVASEPRPSASNRTSSILTSEAKALLRVADGGGVPLFASQNLRRIARENGVEVTDETTPNDVIDALRSRAASSDAARPAPSTDTRAVGGDQADAT
jgi:hypothetical protein